MNNIPMRTRTVIAIISVVPLLLLYGCMPVTTEKRHWTPETLLSRPLASYTSEAMARAEKGLRRQLGVEKARYDYYGAVFKGDYKKAYDFLPKTLQAQISLSDFTTSYTDLFRKSSHPSSVITLGSINGIRILREYLITLSDEQCNAAIVELSVDSTVQGKPGPSQTLATLDIWGTDGNSAYVIPGNFAQWKASY